MAANAIVHPARSTSFWRRIWNARRLTRAGIAPESWTDTVSDRDPKRGLGRILAQRRGA